MKNLNHIVLINKSLHSEKEKYLNELAKLNTFIDKKINSIGRISNYLSEYADEANLKISKKIPSLSKNINLFSKQIDQIILSEKKEVEKLKLHRDSTLEKIQHLDQRIDAISHFEKMARSDLQNRISKKEQFINDEISLTKSSRGRHE